MIAHRYYALEYQIKDLVSFFFFFKKGFSGSYHVCVSIFVFVHVFVLLLTFNGATSALSLPTTNHT